jgi:ABC-type nitrate/sulfonate/bicarbonate transport system substrate-binding protein
MTRLAICLLAVLLIGLVAADQGGNSQGGHGNNECRHTINYGSFVKDALFQVATARGFFDDERVCVNYFAVAGSVAQFDSFSQGAYDIVWTAFDNVVARTVLQGKPYSVVAAHDAGAQYVLLGNTNNGINSISDLQGKPIAVDAPNSGLVFALRKMLANAGVTDYTFQSIGGFARIANLNSGWWNRTDPVTGQFLSERVYATVNSWPGSLFSPPNVKVLGRVQDDPTMNPFQNIILAVNATAAADDDKADDITAFLRAYIRASAYINEPRNKDSIISIFQAGFGQTAAVAASLYDTIYSPYGNPNGIRPTRQGMINAMQARAFTNAVDPTCACGFPAGTDFAALTAPRRGGLVDMFFLRRAFLTLDRDDELAALLN